MDIFTIGHSTRTLEDFIALLKEQGIDTLIDVRSSPYSKHNPQFNKEILGRGCRSNRIKYLWMEKLGGFRKGGYKEYTKTPAFKNELKKLEKTVKQHKACVLCSEYNPYKCHRRYIADALKRKGFQVIHLFHENRKEGHLIAKKRTIKCDKL